MKDLGKRQNLVGEMNQVVAGKRDKDKEWSIRFLSRWIPTLKSAERRKAAKTCGWDSTIDYKFCVFIAADTILKVENKSRYRHKNALIVQDEFFEFDSMKNQRYIGDSVFAKITVSPAEGTKSPRTQI